MLSWTSANAKRHFAQVLLGLASGPQLLTLRNKPVGVVQSYEAFMRQQVQTGEKSLGQWLEELAALHGEEGDPDIPARSDRSDSFGDSWE
jgi:prevent-host-death family protein